MTLIQAAKRAALAMLITPFAILAFLLGFYLIEWLLVAPYVLLDNPWTTIAYSFYLFCVFTFVIWLFD